MGKYSLPLGFRFHPTDVELVMYYLKRKVLGKKFSFEAIAEIDIYKYAPWDLPDLSSLKSGDLKWFFFCPVGKKNAGGTRLNRATVYGYWKATGKDRPVMYDDKVAGMIKTLVFHQGKAPHGDRTDWVMHEYRLEEKDLVDRGIVQHSYVLCVIFKKDGMGPRNGAQYGAPFKEEDWSDDEESVAFGSSDFPQRLCIEPPLVVSTETNGALTCTDTTPAVPVVVPVVVDAAAQQTQVDNIESMLDIFREDDAFMHDNGQMTGNSYGSLFDAIEDSADDELLTMLSYFTEDHDWNNAL